MSSGTARRRDGRKDVAAGAMISDHGAGQDSETSERMRNRFPFYSVVPEGTRLWKVALSLLPLPTVCSLRIWVSCFPSRIVSVLSSVMIPSPLEGECSCQWDDDDRTVLAIFRITWSLIRSLGRASGSLGRRPNEPTSRELQSPHTYLHREGSRGHFRAMIRREPTHLYVLYLRLIVWNYGIVNVPVIAGIQASVTTDLAWRAKLVRPVFDRHK